MHNMSSAREQAQVVRDYLSIECATGRVLGPLNPTDIPGVHVSSLGVIPKETPGKWHQIMDHSSLEGASVNDGVGSEICSLQYVSVEDAAQAVVANGAGTLLAKVDVARVYRNIPIHPDDRWLLGMMWEGHLFIYTALPFGLRSAPKIFSAVADAVELILQQESMRTVMHYLDDFLLIGAPSSDECDRALATLIKVFHYLGLPIAPDKLEGPCSSLVFLGIEIDSVTMELRLPAEKVVELQRLIQTWCGRRSASKRELESLTASLSHACTVVRCGKTFLRRMFELLVVAHKSHHFVHLNASFRSDLKWWDIFLAPMNGISMKRQLLSPQVAISFASDASGSVGCGAIWPPLWLQYKWSVADRVDNSQLNEDSITLQELLLIVFVCTVWGARWQHSLVRVFCDNLGAVAVVNSGYSKVARIILPYFTAEAPTCFDSYNQPRLGGGRLFEHVALNRGSAHQSQLAPCCPVAV